MQPLAGGEGGNLLVTGAHRRVDEPVNREAFWRKKGEEVAAEDVFFHDYFSRLGEEKQRKQKKEKKAAKAGSDDESDAESEIWQALVDSRPELEGAEGSEDDMDLDELESAMGSDADEEMEDAGGDEDVIFNDESDASEEEEAEAEGEGEEQAPAEEEEDDDEPFGVDASDDEAFVDSDAELPSDIEAAMEREMAAEIAKNEEKPDRSKKRRKLKHLPTFASVEDYAKLLEDEEDGM
ncbi:CBF/Mak21 family protein [Ascosphaera apis ARSEF 7405]|uniref:CBF/Mak21 family protein n=1 Tax=Ascosphaera apis ARSEF 7405 TaxID=392613 RepID=A0A168DQG8_9EURO|nr:CBF/Mak21 family protein [Ascosphaera apis ARSEF 7405]